MADEPRRWGIPEMVVTIVGVLGSVALGAWIVYAIVNRRSAPRMLAAPAPLPQLPPVDLKPQVAQIRALIREANRSDDAATAEQNADQALLMLDSLESSYGYEVVAAACNPDKIRALAEKVKARFTRPLAA